MFWKPGADAPQFLQTEENKNNEVSNFIYNPHKNMPLRNQRQKLPIFNYRNHFLYLVENNCTTIVIGETGSGKSTQIPQYLYEANWTGNHKQIAVTQPRRNSVITLCTRVADEMGCYVGSRVGYKIRFETCTTDDTSIVYLTDGIILREIMADPLLRKYSIIVVDEVHERNINTDLLIALLRKIQKQRPDLKLVLTSATTDAEKLLKFFRVRVQGEKFDPTTSVILSVEGKNFPIQVNFAVSSVPDYVKASVETAISIHENKPLGDVLVFLTSQDEVVAASKSCREIVSKLIKPKQNVSVHSYYGSLPADEQIKIFNTTSVNKSTRRIIFSTNLAESSITISRIIYVIDCGFSRFKTFNSQSGLEIIIKAKISKSSAVQRAGRAGRVGHGEVYRLYTEQSYSQMLVDTPPEITRSNLFTVVLQLKAIGISNIIKFNFLTPPPPDHMSKTLEVLHALNAIDDECRLTARGFIFVEFPINPMLTAVLLNSEKYQCTEEILIIISMLQVKNVFVKSSHQNKRFIKEKFKFATQEGDHLTLLNVFKFFEESNKSRATCKEHLLNYQVLCQADNIRRQLRKLVQRYVKTIESTNNEEAILKCLTSGMYFNTAYYHHAGVYKTFKDSFDLSIHPSSVLASQRPKYVLFTEVLCSSTNYMKDITVIDSAWLTEVAPHYYIDKFLKE